MTTKEEIESLRAEMAKLREQNEALIKALGALASQPPVQIVPYCVPQPAPIVVPYIVNPVPTPWWANPPVIYCSSSTADFVLPSETITSVTS